MHLSTVIAYLKVSVKDNVNTGMSESLHVCTYIHHSIKHKDINTTHLVYRHITGYMK